jgi:hypothetical protein
MKDLWGFLTNSHYNAMCLRAICMWNSLSIHCDLFFYCILGTLLYKIDSFYVINYVEKSILRIFIILNFPVKEKNKTHKAITLKKKKKKKKTDLMINNITWSLFYFLCIL